MGSHLRLGHQQMNMLRHDHIADHDEAVALASLFENGEKSIAGFVGSKKWQSPITRAGDKVQVVSAVGAVQAGGHGQFYGIGSIVPALAQNARAGHPQFRNGKKKTDWKGWA